MTSANGSCSVGYVLRKFPVLSETFILNEILALEARGLPVHIFSLERPNDPRFHEGLARLQASISYVPGVAELSTLWPYRAKVARHYASQYGRAVAYALKHGKPTLFLRFLQACYVADRSRRFRVGHFHAHFATRPTSVAFFASIITGMSYSFTAHAMDIYKEHLSRKALGRKLGHARFVATVSDYNMKFLAEAVGENPGNLVRVLNGIDMSRFHPNGSVSAPPFVFICVARLVEKKGHGFLVDACARLRDRALDFECWLVGKGRCRLPIQERIKKLKLKRHVKLLGALRQGEVLNRYHASHAYVLPCVVGSDGNRDGLPVSIVEALACGLPVISTAVTGIPEVVHHERNGLLVPQGDVAALACAMERMIRDKPLCHRLQAGARPSVEKDFDIDVTIGTLKGLFESSMA